MPAGRPAVHVEVDEIGFHELEPVGPPGRPRRARARARASIAGSSRRPSRDGRPRERDGSRPVPTASSRIGPPARAARAR